MILVATSCLMLMSGAFAADGADSKSGLSATVTESYQIRNKQFGDLLRPETQLAIARQADLV